MSLNEEEINRLKEASGASGKMDLPGDTTSYTIPEITTETRDKVLTSLCLPLVFDNAAKSEAIANMAFEEILYLGDHAEKFAQKLNEQLRSHYTYPFQGVQYLFVDRETLGLALTSKAIRIQFGDNPIKNLSKIEPDEATDIFFHQDFSFMEPPIILNRALNLEKPIIPPNQPNLEYLLRQFIVAVPDGAQFVMRGARGMYDLMEENWNVLRPLSDRLKENPENFSL